MPVTIEPSIVGRFPGVIVQSMTLMLPASGLRPPPKDEAAVSDLALEGLAEHPRIAIWRAAAKAMGLKAAEHRSSIEQLLRRWLRGAPPETGIALVDWYNAISVTALAPMGAYDLAAFEGGLKVRGAEPGSDQFEPLGGRAWDFPLRESVVVYAAGDTVVSWGFNVRDSAVTAISALTRHTLIVSEALDLAGSAASQSALQRLGEVVIAQGGDASAVSVASIDPRE